MKNPKLKDILNYLLKEEISGIGDYSKLISLLGDKKKYLFLTRGRFKGAIIKLLKDILKEEIKHKKILARILKYMPHEIDDKEWRTAYEKGYEGIAYKPEYIKRKYRR